MDKAKKQLVVTVVAVGAIFGGTLGTFLLMQVAWNTEIPVVVVTSGSMEPTIYRGDVLFIQGVPPETIEAGDHALRTGDVIVYDTRGVWTFPLNEPVVHRVVNKTFSGGKWYFTTFGDNNFLPDLFLVPEDKVYGKVTGIIPKIGHVKLFLDESGIAVPLLVVLLVALVASIAWDAVKERKQPAKAITGEPAGNHEGGTRP